MSDFLLPTDLCFTPARNMDFVDGATPWHGLFVVKHKDLTFSVFNGLLCVKDLTDAKSYANFASAHHESLVDSHLKPEKFVSKYC